MAKQKKKAKSGETERKETPQKAPEAQAEARKVLKKKSPEERRRAQIEGIKKTLVSSILGIISGVICYNLLGNGTDMMLGGVRVEWHFILLNLILITTIVQRFIYPLIGIDVLSFKGKDWFYVEFIVVDLWAVTWTILLN
ncbi:hypothetical protein [Methanothrix sp.]|uniref:EMC6-like membrane protein n=1 Tax=Methanothrix sp. TaxID=90426 RepID=UPI002C3F253C|nr:hypothetical protein [Methanothrix sp.]HOK58163.1 hypothetical protein [Methanothrix sp.]HOL43487.1 hypothetical protein [Methanothrix sp.]HPO88638.1 hypothetical protein [Methanothrix sp.]